MPTITRSGSLIHSEEEYRELSLQLRAQHPPVDWFRQAAPLAKSKMQLNELYRRAGLLYGADADDARQAVIGAAEDAGYYLSRRFGVVSFQEMPQGMIEKRDRRKQQQKNGDHIRTIDQPEGRQAA